MEEEFLTFISNKRTLHYIDAYRKKRNLKREEMNILDWGCGRGRDVLWLREQGYNAYGVDIDIESIRNGINLFKAKGYDDLTLGLLSPEGKTNFPDNFFHFTFSNQVFEHVSNIEAVADEIRRITVKNGMGYHVYPAHKYVVEGHLFMPFIHWLPKNKLRKYLILVYVYLGREPRWRELEDSRFSKKVEAYYQYSINKTYYRKYPDVRKAFQNNGFRVIFDTINRPKVQNNKFIGKLTNYKLSKSVLNYLLLTFKSQDLLIYKL